MAIKLLIKKYETKQLMNLDLAGIRMTAHNILTAMK